MKTVTDNRRDWLEHLISEMGSIAALNIALGRSKTDATLSQIRNQSPHNKTGKPRTMGDKIARSIEEKLGMTIGCMDYPVGQVASATSNLAQENKGPYVVQPPWPFMTITPFDWLSISALKKQFIEEQIKAMIPASSKQHNAA